MEPLLDRIRSGRVVVGDGAWGTELMARGLLAGDCPEVVNLDRPEVLAEVGALYLDAGAEYLTTNTFGASPLKLARYGLDERCEEINRAGVEAVRRCAGGRAWVWASIGPCGRILKPYGDVGVDTVRNGFVRQAGALVAAGADVLCVETMTDLREATLAVEAARAAAPGLPIVATMTFDPTPRGYVTIMGTTLAAAAAGLEHAGADVVGSNCGNGIQEMVEIARELRACTALPLAIQSNAGLPENRDGEVVYPETPEHMARHAVELARIGVAVVGGCCGAGPEHIRAIRHAIHDS